MSTDRDDTGQFEEVEIPVDVILNDIFQGIHAGQGDGQLRAKSQFPFGKAAFRDRERFLEEVAHVGRGEEEEPRFSPG